MTDYDVTIEVPEYALTFGIPGVPGPPGPPGIVRVNHGANASVARPVAAIVLWVGSVEPVNANQSVDLIVWTA